MHLFGFMAVLFILFFLSAFYVHWLIIIWEEEENSDIEMCFDSK